MAEAPVELLQRVPLFADFESGELARLARSFKERTFDAGSHVVDEGKTGAGHKEGPENEHPPTPNAVRLGCENQGNDRVPQEYQGEKHSDPRFTESNAGQIEDENNGQRAVSK